MSFGGGNQCRVCNKAVYHAEKAEGFDDVHKRCCRCAVCGKSLDSTTQTMHEGGLYCRSCYGQNFGQHGYGFGGGAAGPMSNPNPEKIGSTAPVTAVASKGKIDPADLIDGGPDICPRCGKRVYKAEERIGASKKWHRGCFRCIDCGKSLDSNTIASKDIAIYCKACYGKHHGPKGFGFGIGAGTLTHTQ